MRRRGSGVYSSSAPLLVPAMMHSSSVSVRAVTGMPMPSHRMITCTNTGRTVKFHLQKCLLRSLTCRHSTANECTALCIGEYSHAPLLNILGQWQRLHLTAQGLHRYAYSLLRCHTPVRKASLPEREATQEELIPAGSAASAG